MNLSTHPVTKPAKPAKGGVHRGFRSFCHGLDVKNQKRGPSCEPSRRQVERKAQEREAVSLALAKTPAVYRSNRQRWDVEVVLRAPPRQSEIDADTCKQLSDASDEMPRKGSTHDRVAPGYLANLNHGHNIGVLLGQASNGLCTIDCDDDAALEAFLRCNPQLRDSLISRGVTVCFGSVERRS